MQKFISPVKIPYLMERHFTATAYVLYDNKVLLHFHSKLKKWLPPGGHIEPDETPPDAVRREVKEETGLDIILIRQENLTVHSPNANSFERPFLCLLESVPAHGLTPAHEHMDLIYLAHPKSGVDVSIAKEKGFVWFGWNDLATIEDELFIDTKQMLEILLKTTNDCDVLLQF
jgi:8-oxo-dGTP pyrophosphatase MutT (NUDIX family)